VPDSGGNYAYAPHGNIDNPYHRWIVNRGGVLHTSLLIGLGWFYPCSPGARYKSILRVGAGLGGTALYSAAHFERAEIASSCHSNNIKGLSFPLGDVNVRVVYFLAPERIAHWCEVRVWRLRALVLSIPNNWNNLSISNNLDMLNKRSDPTT
jgi:hypothetical protein